MALTYGFALQPTDTSKDFSDALHALVGDGVTAQGARFLLTVNGFTATAGSGYAFAAGRWLENDEPLALPVQPSGNTDDRTDALVIRVDYETRKAALEILVDVDPAAIRENLALLRNEREYSILLYLIRVRRGVTALTPADVTDLRVDENLCGTVVPLSAIAGDVLRVYNFLLSGIDKEVARLIGLSEQVAQKADAAITELDAAIQKAGGGADIGELMTARRAPLDAVSWLLCDGREVPAEYPVLSAVLSGTLPNISQAGDRYRTYIYGGEPSDDPAPPTPPETKKYTISLMVDPDGGGTATGGGEIEEGESVTVSATPSTDYEFVEWRENGRAVSLNSSYTFEVDSDRTLTAAFKAAPKPAIFGVMWDYANSSPALERLMPSTDPNRYVTKSVSTEPVAAVGAGAGSSPFDDFMPWAGMEEYNVIDGEVRYKQGEAGFSRTAYDTMVYIPEFWYQCVDDAANSKRYWYVSDTEVEGFERHPGSGKYVGRYTANGSYMTVSGNTSVVNVTRATARTNTKAKGAGWQLYDYATLCAVQLLYLVEYADWNSQAKIGRGYVDGNPAQTATGATDSMVYHTGRAAGTDGKTAIQYRHIENMWGNLYQIVDGINTNETSKVYVSTNPFSYEDSTSSGYVAASRFGANGYIAKIGFSESAKWAFIPEAAGGSENTYICDYSHGYSYGWGAPYVGGYWEQGSVAGAFCFYGASPVSSYGGNLTMRAEYSSG